jgi:hypothetical protein
MATSLSTDRRILLREVQERIHQRLGPEFETHAFRLVRRDWSYRRARDAVSARFSLGVSSRPPSLGYVGILIQPGLVISVPEWMDEAKRRLSGQTGRWLRSEVPAPAIWQMLEWLMPDRQAAWRLPDRPTAAEVDALARNLHRATRDVALPLFDRLGTPTAMAGVVVFPSA